MPTRYDLGVSDGAMTLPGVSLPLVVTHTSVSFGIGGKGVALCRRS